jgi:hypothetical protein
MKVEMSIQVSQHGLIYIFPRDHQDFTSFPSRGRCVEGGTKPLSRLYRRVIEVLHFFVCDIVRPLSLDAR